MKKLYLLSLLLLLVIKTLGQTAYRVKDINPGGQYSYSSPNKFTDVNGTLFFEAFTPSSGGELWKSDGTDAGTTMVKEIYAGASNADIQKLKNINGVLYFTANDGVNGFELWKSDGTSAGTSMVKDIRTGSGSSYSGEVIYFADKIFFVAADNTNGTAIWTTDGTDGGTVLFKDLDPAGAYGGAAIYNFTVLNNTLYFWGNVNGIISGQLWKSDGTVAGTVMVKSFAGVVGPPLIASGNYLFFPYGGGATGAWGIWASDGTDAGTICLKNMNVNSIQNFPSNSNLVDVNGIAMFTADDGLNGIELWKSDGTVSGTQLVKDIRPGNVSGLTAASYLTNHNGIIYFSATDGTNGQELWKSDGTSAGTVMVEPPFSGTSNPINLYSYNGYLFFSDGEVWKVDGTSGGTSLVADILPGVNGSGAKLFTGCNNKVFFSANDGSTGIELWAMEVTAVSSTRDRAEMNSVNIYPNPAQHTLYLFFNDHSYNGSTATIYNSLGYSIATFTGDRLTERTVIDLSSYPKGIYFVEVANKSGRKNYKVILQ